MYDVGTKVKFKMLYSPFAIGLGTIKAIYSGDVIALIDFVYLVEIEEVTNYYQAGDDVYIFPREIIKEVYFP
jgi:hypothetical protein